MKKHVVYSAIALLLSTLLWGCGHSPSQKADGSKQETQIEKSKRLDEQQQ